MFTARAFSCRLLRIPHQILRRFCRFFYQLEAGARSAEALLYLQVLRQVWPEALDELMPRVKLPSNALPDIASWYIKARHPGSLQRQLNDIIVSMAEGLVSLPLSTKIALFEEALRITSENSPAVFARYIRFLARFSDSDERLTAVGDRFFTFGPSIWNKSFKDAWGLYLSALARIGRVDEALEILERCDKKYRLSGIETIPPAALFARDNGYSNRAVGKAAELMRITRENEERGVLTGFISGKRVAIVGSSPLERGRGRGAEIDGYDIVIRFNNAPAGKRFSTDFGCKTTILSRNLAPPWLPIPSEAGVILIPDGLERTPLRQETIKAFLAASREGKLVCEIPLVEYRSIMREAGIPHLSTGAVVCAYIKRLVPELSRHDLYGFSHFLDDVAVNYGVYEQFHYYGKKCDEPEDMSFHEHPLARERKFLISLFPEAGR